MKYDSKYSLTGDEFLDFLSWCEAQGIDFEGNNKEDEEENQNDYNEENNELIYKKERKR